MPYTEFHDEFRVSNDEDPTGRARPLPGRGAQNDCSRFFFCSTCEAAKTVYLRYGALARPESRVLKPIQAPSEDLARELQVDVVKGRVWLHGP